jgi:4-hydroxythreonine-4-phosphate dehydrogenase
LVDFSTSANLTLGLKHVRTSPDHGTAFEIAGKGVVDGGSFESALRLAEILSSQ